MATPFTFKQRVGCWLYERRSAETMMLFPMLERLTGRNWLDLKNRHELISIDPVSKGRICHWADSSALTVARVFPHVGARILHESLKRWPVTLNPDSGFQTTPSSPDVSFVIGVRGTRRLDQFRTVIRSLSNQQGVSTEIIVVEQSVTRDFESVVPTHARYVHTPLLHPQMPFNRSWALNAGANVANGRILVLHDADMVVPAGFAAAIHETIRGNVEALRLPRFIFYLDRPSSELVQQTGRFDGVQKVDRIVQNNPTPMAITRDAYRRIGGHDESFYGWGGEDNEFLDRVRTLNLSEGAFLPVFHLWHEEAPNRSGDRNAAYLQKCLCTPATQRIDLLASRSFGQSVPSVSWVAPAERETS